jgi:hypothetical protein
MKTVILNVATGILYTLWQLRLKLSLSDIDYAGDCLMWTDEMPPHSPTHQEVPYAFKVFAFLEARRRGYDAALWLDSALVALKPLDPVWDYLELGPGYEFHHSEHRVGEWCSDAALEKHGLTRDEAMNIHDNWACLIGLNFHCAAANEFLDQWHAAALDGVSFHGAWTNENQSISKDPRCKGHRHDQCISAILCHQMGLERIPWDPPRLFGYHFQELNDSVCLMSMR